jgi:O-methyltransferase
MYESTIDAIEPLYPKLSPGGYCIVDDYVSHSGARQAVDDYRKKHGITEPIEAIDWAGAYWRKAL